MQILKKNKRMLIGIIVGVLISSFVSYAIAETLINSKDVVYEDNSNLVADNVQDAIDGTCSKIDTRLSDIEDKLYTVKKIYASKYFSSTTELLYTGVSVDLPANSYCGITATADYNFGLPVIIELASSSSSYVPSLAYYHSRNAEFNTAHLSVSYNTYTDSDMTVFLWASYDRVSQNWVYINGYCATKYK